MAFVPFFVDNWALGRLFIHDSFPSNLSRERKSEVGDENTVSREEIDGERGSKISIENLEEEKNGGDTIVQAVLLHGRL